MTKIDRLAIYERDGGMCGFCGEHVPWELLQLDHIRPVGLGGMTVPDNLRVAHRRCNIAAGKQVISERRRLGMGSTGRSMVRIAFDLHAWLTDLANREHRSLNSQIIYLLEQARDQPGPDSRRTTQPD